VKSGAKATKSGAKVARTRVVKRSRGQQAIDSERVIQIQQALIREHYMTGDATGNWDSSTIAAMQKFQADQGWQTKLMPDSRALKKLGLGPDYSNAINASGSSFANPARRGTTTPEQSAAFAEAAGVHQ
jgi:peptidoglycan hydrolase-like protein with peptidoglycan-binding domain